MKEQLQWTIESGVHDGLGQPFFLTMQEKEEKGTLSNGEQK